MKANSLCTDKKMIVELIADGDLEEAIERVRILTENSSNSKNWKQAIAISSTMGRLKESVITGILTEWTKIEAVRTNLTYQLLDLLEKIPNQSNV